MIALVGLLVGAIAGTLLGHGFIETVQGALIGLIVGFVIGEVRKSRRRSASADALTLLDPRVAQRLRAMERRIETLERAIATGLAPREVRTEPSAAAALEVPQDAARAAGVARAPAQQTTRPQGG
jgi:prepilin signal peptidase PulO-like enzyme (type II secretory pathway)